MSSVLTLTYASFSATSLPLLKLISTDLLQVISNVPSDLDWLMYFKSGEIKSAVGADHVWSCLLTEMEDMGKHRALRGTLLSRAILCWFEPKLFLGQGLGWWA